MPNNRPPFLPILTVTLILACITPQPTPDTPCPPPQYFINLKCQDHSGLCAEASGPEKILKKCVDNSQACANFDTPSKTCKLCAKTHKLTHDPHRGTFCSLRSIYSIVGIGAIIVLALILIGALIILTDWIQTKNSQRNSQLPKTEAQTHSDTNPVNFPQNKLESSKSQHDDFWVKIFFNILGFGANWRGGWARRGENEDCA